MLFRSSIGMQQLSVQLADAAATQNLGRQLALDWLALPQPRPILLLEGDLGAGKTSLVQGIALALEIEEPITIKALSAATGIKSSDILKWLFKKGVMSNINSAIDTEAAMEIALEYDIELEVQEKQSAEQKLQEEFEAIEIGRAHV